MITKRTAVIVLFCAMLGAWLVYEFTPPGARQTAAVSSSPQARQSPGPGVGGEVVRLREPLRSTAVPAQSRDLFRYAAGSNRAEPAARAEPAEVEPVPAPPVGPVLRLVGVAEDRTPEGTARTAIIAGPGALFVVREGELVAARYRVTSVSPDAVELTDIERADTLRLPLK